MAIFPYQTEILADSPQMFYQFGEASGATAADSSGNGKTLTLSGTYTRNVAELLFNALSAGKALSVNGAGGSASGFSVTSSGISVSMLLKLNSLAGDPKIFGSGDLNGTTGGYFGLHYLTNSNELRWYYKKSDNTGFTYAAFQITLPLDSIFHLAVTHDLSTKIIKVYCDGILIGSQTTPTSANLLSNQTISFFENLNATIDELAFFNSPLSQSRIEAQFAASRGADSTLTDYYVSPTGSLYGRGTKTDPLDFYAGINSVFAAPGKNILALDGDYKRNPSRPNSDKTLFVIYRSGAPGNRLTIKPAPGAICTIDGEGYQGNVIELRGSFIDFLGFFGIRKTWSTRTSTIAKTDGCPIVGTNGTLEGSGIADFGDNNRVIYNLVHDCLGEGIASQGSATNARYYHNVFIVNGWFAPRTTGGAAEGNGHGCYAQNHAPSTKKFEYNLFINPYSTPIKFAGSGDAFIENFLAKGNVTVGGQHFSDVGGGDVGANDCTVEENYSFNSDWKIGYNSGNGRIISILNNYFSGNAFPLEILDFNQITFTGNTVVGKSGTDAIIGVKVRTAPSNSTVNNNTYHHNRAGASTIFVYSPVQGGSYNGYTFSGWKSLTGWDANSTYVSNGTNFTKPTTNLVKVQNCGEFEQGRGYVLVYNWENFDSQIVDLSPILNHGQRFKIFSATNPLDSDRKPNPIFTATFNSGSPNYMLPLKLSEELPATRQPYGDAGRAAETAPDFAAFIVIPVAGVQGYIWGKSGLTTL